VEEKRESMLTTKHQTFLNFDAWCESTRGVGMEEKEKIREDGRRKIRGDNRDKEPTVPYTPLAIPYSLIKNLGGEKRKK